MKMPAWVRNYVPHPPYGNWCGAKNTHDRYSEAPAIDKGDWACYCHDKRLLGATQDEKHCTDALLWRAWKDFKPRTWYGKAYRRGVLVAFKNEYCK